MFCLSYRYIKTLTLRLTYLNIFVVILTGLCSYFWHKCYSHNSLAAACIMHIYRYQIIWVWRYQRGNKNSYIEEEQITKWPKEKVRKDKQRSIKRGDKTKYRAKRTPLPHALYQCVQLKSRNQNHLDD
jgi:hypothetical protein